MLTFSLQMESKAKPAGALMNGHITQNKNGYTDWKARAKEKLIRQKTKYKTVPFPLISGQVYGILIEHHVHSYKCGDLLNIVGATMDTLVKSGIIKDDCPTIVNRVICRMARLADKEQKDHIEIAIALNRKEWLGVVEANVIQ